jgi:ribose transport system ATP-binding protein
MADTVSLTATNIVKRYGGVIALADGNINIKSGEVVALLGANGSGKSTLTKIITGVVDPNEGQLLLDGHSVQFASPQSAQAAGITAVYQELSLVPDMTVAENVFLAHEPRHFGLTVKTNEMRANTQALIDLFDGTVSADLTPDALVIDLSPDEKQIVEILKGLSIKPRIMILDEATASLDSQQVNRLFDLVLQWKAQNMGVVFVSHRMDEIFRVADVATVLRNGRTVGTRVIEETNERELVQLMIEEATTPRHFAHSSNLAELPVRLRVKGLQTDVLRGIDFDLRDGELLGLGGLQGQGQDDVLLALFGAIPFRGDVIFSEENVSFKHPREAMKAGIAFVPGDRGEEGLLLIRSILENLHLPSWQKFGVPLDMETARTKAREVSQSLSLVMSSIDAPVSSLSGGNAQKVVIGKWLLRNPDLLLLNDPTKGVDVGAKGEFYNLLAELRESGTAILFNSSDDEELLGLCDRILVLHEGTIEATLEGDSLNKNNLVAASMAAHERDTHD